MFAWLVKHPAPVALMVLCISVFGLITYGDLPRESAPDVKVPVVMVSTPYIGVAPRDVETLLTIPLENELSGLKDLKKMSSTSAEGVSLITLEFVPEVQIQDVLQRVRASSRIVLAYAAYVAVVGALLAAGYEEGTARPFLLFGAVLVPLLLLARAWGAAGSQEPRARGMRAALCAASALGAAFLVLEHVDVAYLEGLGL